MQLLGRVRSLSVELDAHRAWGAWGSGELLRGCVRLELRGALRLRALEVHARGRATAHWLESYIQGLNIIYRDYTAYQTFLHRRCQLVPGKAAARGCSSAPGPPWAAGIPSGGPSALVGACPPKQGCPSWTPSPLLLASRRLLANSRPVEHERVVAFVLFARGSANRSICSQVWKEHLVGQ